MAGLAEHRHRPTAILSGGWKQRLALGCAILHRPPILFLDEPTSGVDPISRRQFWELIYQMAGQGMTILVTTHYMDEAEYCDRLGLIYRGDLIACGTPTALKHEAMQKDAQVVPTLEDVFICVDRGPRPRRAARAGGRAMNMRRVWAVARKELLHIMRNPRSMGLAIGIPMLLLMLFGYALTLDVDNVPMVVWDQSNTAASRELVSHFIGSRYFSLRKYLDNDRAVVRAIDSGEALVALVIPRGSPPIFPPAAPRRCN